MGQTSGDGGAAPVAVGAPRGVWPGCRQAAADTQEAPGGREKVKGGRGPSSALGALPALGGDWREGVWKTVCPQESM